jgi:hypothetical protein
VPLLLSFFFLFEQHLRDVFFVARAAMHGVVLCHPERPFRFVVVVEMWSSKAATGKASSVIGPSIQRHDDAADSYVLAARRGGARKSYK